VTRFSIKLISIFLVYGVPVLPVHAADQAIADEPNPELFQTINADTEPTGPQRSSPEMPSQGVSNEVDSSPDSADQDVASKDSLFDVSHKTISENIISLSHTVDSFFSNERYLEESSGSYGCIKASAYFSEGGEIDARASVCLKIDLPTTKKRWKLLLESDDRNDTESFSEDDQRTVVADVQDEKNQGSSAVFRYVAKDELLRYINFDIGVKARTPLDPFTRLRFRRTWVPDPWLFRLTESLYYFTSTAGGFLYRLDMERQIGTDWYLRMTFEADYRVPESQFNLAQNFGFYQSVKKGHALSWELTLVGVSQPNPRVDYYVYKFRYRINLWREWFFFEVSPQLVHERENNFRSVAGILFAAEAVFGNY
jgi:hypothetical protein